MKKLFLPLFLLLISTTLFGQGSGKMLEFNGSSSYVNCGNINLSGTALTLQGWVKFNSFKATSPYISSFIGIESGGTSHAQIRFGDAGQLAERAQFVLYIGGTHQKLNSTTSLNANEWYHIAGTYDGTTMKIYINGELDVQMSAPGSFTANTQFNIGYNYATSRILDGYIDEVSVFKATLSQTTIRNWMARKITSSHPNYSSLEAYYPLNEGTGTSTSDASSNGHNGTFVSNPQWTNSEIPIGDVVSSDFTSPFSLMLSHSDGDTIWANNIIGSPDAAFLYRVNNLPQVNGTMPSGVSEVDTSRYYGFFALGGTNSTATINYRVTSNSKFQNVNSCIFNWYQRDGNADLTWSNANASLSGNYYTKTGVGNSEYILGFGATANIYPSPSQTVCFGDSVVLNHGSSGLTYTWLKNGVVIPGKTSTKLGVNEAGTYQLAYALGTSCYDTTNTFTLTVNPLPNVGFPPLTPVCESVNSVIISGGTPAGGTYSSPFIGGNLFIVNIAGDGNFPITYSYTDANGCRADTVQFLKIKPVPNVNLPSFNTICENDAPVVFSTGTPAGGTYTINGQTATQADPATLGTGLFKVKYSVLDTNGCAGADSSGLIIRSLPTVNLNIPDTMLCESFTPITIKGESPSGGVFNGNGVTGKFFDPSVGSGFHKVTYNYTDPASGCANTAEDSIEVFPTPAKPQLTIVNDSLKATPAFKYYWYTINHDPLSKTGRTIYPDSTGYYYVVVENNYGCQSEASGILLWEKPVIIDPGSVVELGSANPLKVYPNPSSGIINIIGFEIGKPICIFDTQGRVVFNQTPTKNQIEVDLKTGVYIVQSGPFIKKVIIQ